MVSSMSEIISILSKLHPTSYISPPTISLTARRPYCPATPLFSVVSPDAKCSTEVMSRLASRPQQSEQTSLPWGSQKSSNCLSQRARTRLDIIADPLVQNSYEEEKPKRYMSIQYLSDMGDGDEGRTGHLEQPQRHATPLMQQPLLHSYASGGGARPKFKISSFYEDISK